jgi:hypothetical protein
VSHASEIKASQLARRTMSRDEGVATVEDMALRQVSVIECSCG